MKLFVFLLLFVSAAGLPQDRLTGYNFATRSEVLAQNGMACTSHPLATQAAIHILRQGGNAVDAAIAANAVNAVVEPMSCGIGGDLFAIVWETKSRKLYGLNASGRSPRSLTLRKMLEMGLEKIPLRGPLPVSVPGCVDGWFELHEKFGRLPMKQVLEPAIYYAAEGFPVTEVIAYYWQSGAESLLDIPGFADVFLVDGRAPAKGDIFRNPALANTLRNISQQGRETFYRGEIAREIERFLAGHGGYITVDDLSSHKSEWVEPVSTNYRGYDVWELPPNGQGIAVLQMLNILEGYDVRSMGFGSETYLHLFIEAKKLIYEDRARFYADPDFNTIPVPKLISKQYAALRRELIDLNKAADRYDPADLEDGDTIYLTVADRDGNMVSLIQSLYWGFGSGMTPPKLGFPLQNRGELFTFEEGHYNQYAPSKRPFHTIIPGFVTKDGDPFLSFGVMGGAMQPQGHVQVLVNLIDFGMGLQEAGDAPRVRHAGSSQPTGSVMTSGGYVFFESGFCMETIRELLKRGHDMRATVGGFGGYQAIMYDKNKKTFYGASESRKDGQASGF
ncbi:gamma-glutamyltransferase [candidate division KSB1 bacterium]|nr:gamma-glutamyltransferase [candidate division KSB1 bacterium]